MEDKTEINRWSPAEIKTILVPTDLRLESMIALRYALTLAKQASRGIQTWLVGKLP